MIVKGPAQIERFLKAPGRAVRAALIFGPDAGIVRERAEALAAAATERPDDPFDTARLTDGDLADESRLEGELAAISMVGGRRLVRLRLAGDDRAERLSVEALKAHLDGRLNPEAFFCIEAGALRKGAPLRKLAEDEAGCAAIACYEDEPGEVARLARQALSAEGLSLTAEALDTFVARLPHERGVARQEIERLILFLGPGSSRTAGIADLTDFFGVEPEASLFEAASDAFAGRLAGAQASLRRAAMEGESGVAAVRALQIHHARLRKVGVQHAAGTPLQAAARSAGVFWKTEKEFLRQQRAWTLAELEAVQPDLLAAEIACKETGSPDQLIAERAAFAIAAKARRLGL
ncbi:MAG: DNA polymerase III subunit delta [Caulobacteraceae bacterium]|nr:DNA polymerase III subunit delta [Caulobacteraceae bacterium]